MTRRIVPLALAALLAACGGSPTASADSGLVGSVGGRSEDGGALGSGGGRSESGTIGSGVGRSESATQDGGWYMGNGHASSEPTDTTSQTTADQGGGAIGSGT